MFDTLRDELAVELAGVGLEVLTYVPEELPPGPVVILAPAEDYLTQDTDNVFGELTLNLEAFLLVELAGNQQAAEDLDDELRKALGVILGGSSWSLNGVSRPGPFHTLAWLAHGVRLALSTETTL